MTNISEILTKYLENVELSTRQFADALNERLVNTSVSHVSVANWRSGAYEPASDFLCLVLMKYRDWRFDFALECLAAKLPEVWGWPEGGVWEAGREMDAMREINEPA